MTVDETRRREAISKTAKQIRENAERNSVPMSQSDAERRVRQAVTRGDKIRENDHK